MSRSTVFWILLGIVLLGAGIRCYELTARSLWFDEAFSWRLIQFPLHEMIARDAADVHPPLYYILLQGWGVVFGTSLLSLRSFSVACAGISLLASYLFASYAFRTRLAGITAALFLALSPWAISYAWEARMYPLGMVFALLSSWALLHAIREKSVAWFAFYGLLASGLAYTHYYGFFTILVHILFVLGVLVRSTKWRVGEMVQSRIFWGGLLSFCIAALLFAPWLPTFLQQRSQVQASFWIPPVTLTAVSDTFYQFFIPTLSIPRLYGLATIPCILTLLLCAYTLIRYKKSDGVWLTVLLGIVPIIVGAGISLGTRSLYNDRFFAFTGIFLFILLAYVVSEIRKPVIRTSMYGICIAGLLGTFGLYWNELGIMHKGGAAAASDYVFEHRAGDDAVLVSSPYVYFAILYYATENFQASRAVHLYSKTEELSHFSGAPILTEEDIVRESDIGKEQGTVWVIDTTGFTEQPFTAPEPWKEVSKRIFPEVFVYQGDIIVRKFTVQ